MKQFKGIIKNVSDETKKNRWFVEYTDGVLVCTQFQKNATVFHEEWDAEAQLALLNDALPQCFTLLT